MRAVTLIARSPIDLEALQERFRDSDRVGLQSASRLVVAGDWGWFAFDADQKVGSEFEEADIEKFRAAIATPFFLLLEYSTTDAAERAISSLPSDDFLIDNDHGLVLPVAEVRRRIQSRENWQTASV